MSERTDDKPDVQNLAGGLGAERERFLDAIGAIRPRLHQFCARMSGSVFDGEDIIQEALAHAFFKLPTLKEQARFEPWLFRIAHNKAIDFLRRQPDGHSWQEAEEEVVVSIEDELNAQTEVSSALATAVTRLPPKERACLVLKELLGYTLEETAEIAGSTLAGVKAALHRARSKLADVEQETTDCVLSREERALLAAYVEHFNRQDWNAMRDLIRADAKLELVGHIEARGAEFIEANYFRNYAGLPWEWRFSVCEVDGELAAVLHKRTPEDWLVHSAFRLTWTDGAVSEIRDYIHVPYLLRSARVRELPDGGGDAD